MPVELSAKLAMTVVKNAGWFEGQGGVLDAIDKADLGEAEERIERAFRVEANARAELARLRAEAAYGEASYAAPVAMLKRIIDGEE